MSRRQLLAGISSGAAASVAGLAFATNRSRAFTETTRLQTGEIDGLVLDWRETYNGATLTETATGTATVSPSGPAISLGNVLPGDSGSLSVRLRIDAEDGRDLSVEPELTVSLAGDRGSPGLEEFLKAAVWYDTGLFSVGAFGAENTDRDPGERLVHPEATGTLADVGAILRDGITLDSSPTTPGNSCLGAGGAIAVTFGWSFPHDQENINAAQGDAVGFDIHFGATQC